jgi:hypothetical protein
MRSNIQLLLENRLVKVAFILITILLYYFYSFQNYDIAPSDDDVYLKTGLLLDLPSQKFNNLLYPMGMFIFSKIFSDNTTLIYSYYYFLSIAMFLSMVLFLKKYCHSFFIAFFISTCFLFSSFQIHLQPRITILNLIFGLVFLTIIDKNRSQSTNWGITALALLLCNYVSRPEFFWFFCFATLLFIYFTVSSKTLVLNKKIILVMSFAAFVAMFYFIGGGINEPGKLKVAFIQHFFDNYKVWYGKSFDYDEEFEVFDKVYGVVNSNFDLIKANPSFFIKHVFTNFTNYIVLVFKIFKSSFYDITLPVFKEFGKFVFIAIIIGFSFLINFRQSATNFYTLLKNHKSYFGYFFMFFLPIIMAILVVYPRNHYTIIHTPIYFLLFAFLLKAIVLKNPKNSLFIFASLCLFISLCLISYFPLKMTKPSNLAFYKCLKTVKSPTKINLLSNDIFGLSYYAGNYTRIGWNTKTTDLVATVNSQKYDAISFYQLDLEIESNRQFIKEGHKKTNYIRIPDYEKVNRYLWVKPELAQLFKVQ